LIIKLNIEFNINIILLLRGNKGLRLETSIHHPELIMILAKSIKKVKKWMK
jgi:hypothetical protein